MKTDREIVEYLDESVVWHELVPVDGMSEYYCHACDLVVRALEDRMAEHDNPTPTLEWMLERLYEMNINFEFDPIDYTGKEKRCITIHNEEQDNYFLGEGETLTLALRGAVEKMMEDK